MQAAIRHIRSHKTGLINENIEYDKEDKSFNIDGCCGGGCCVVVGMTHCPFCGTDLREIKDDDRVKD